jgi:oligoribonuclease
MATDRLVWVDCEMTGLDPQTDALLEIAVLVTDGDLQVLGEGVDLVVKPPAEAVTAMSDFVRRMHQESGLLEELDSGVTLDEATTTALEYVNQHVPEHERAPLAGSSVHMDRLFLSKYMPRFEQRLHYRNVDVSSIKELARRWYPKNSVNAPVKSGNHRALADIKDSISELAYYRSAVFVPSG